MSPLHPDIIAVLGNSHCFMTFEHMLYMITYKILQYLLVSGKKFICHNFKCIQMAKKNGEKQTCFNQLDVVACMLCVCVKIDWSKVASTEFQKALLRKCSSCKFSWNWCTQRFVSSRLRTGNLD